MTSRINVSKADILDNPGKLSENIRLLIEFEAFDDINTGKASKYFISLNFD